MTSLRIFKFGLPAIVVTVAFATGSTFASQETDEPAFYATTEPGAIAIFSSSDKTATCSASVPFSYLNAEGERKPGRHICQDSSIQVGDDLVVCSANAKELVEPKLEGPVIAECKK